MLTHVRNFEADGRNYEAVATTTLTDVAGEADLTDLIGQNPNLYRDDWKGEVEAAVVVDRSQPAEARLVAGGVLRFQRENNRLEVFAVGATLNGDTAELGVLRRAMCDLIAARKELVRQDNKATTVAVHWGELPPALRASVPDDDNIGVAGFAKRQEELRAQRIRKFSEDLKKP